MKQAPGSPRGFFLFLSQGQPVGWVERSETHHPATRAPAAKAMVFAFGSTHPADWHQARRNSLSVLMRSTRSSGVYGRAATRPQTGAGQAGSFSKRAITCTCSCGTRLPSAATLKIGRAHV